MFSSGPNYNKLKTNLRLAINRLKLLEKKKTEMALKSRKEIADYIASGKTERAKIRVEHIIREDYMVEAMEVLEMYCDLLLARFGLIQQMKTLDDGLAEAISSLIWVSPRLQSDVGELKMVCDQFTAKYGKPYAQACKENSVGTVSAKLMHKLSVQAPPKITVEKYLIEIAKYYNVEYEPDPQIMSQDEMYSADNLIELAPPPPPINKNDLDNDGGNMGGGGFAAPPAQPFQYPNIGGGGAAASHPNISAPPPFQYNIPPQAPGPGPQQHSPDINDSIKYKTGFDNLDEAAAPPPYYPSDKPKLNSDAPPPASAPGAQAGSNVLDLPDLPAVPSDTPLGGNTPGGGQGDDEEIDFDDLTKRFEALKKKK